jgi:hypothetical protein
VTDEANDLILELLYAIRGDIAELKAEIAEINVILKRMVDNLPAAEETVRGR